MCHFLKQRAHQQNYGYWWQSAFQQSKKMILYWTFTLGLSLLYLLIMWNNCKISTYCTLCCYLVYCTTLGKIIGQFRDFFSKMLGKLDFFVKKDKESYFLNILRKYWVLPIFSWFFPVHTQDFPQNQFCWI